MEYPWTDTLSVRSHQAAGVLVKHDEAWRVGRVDYLVGIIHTVGSVEVEKLPMHQNRSMGGVMLADAVFLHDIEQP